MHPFSDLVQHSAAFTLNALESAQATTIEELQNSAETPLVKTLQMVSMQKAISSVGMFSMFDAILQRKLGCDNGFKKAEEILEQKGELKLKERFKEFQCAINVLKHGKGRSYDALVKKAGSLPFKVKLPGEVFFNEGDIGEVSTLVMADDTFVLKCAEVIHEVSLVIKSRNA